VAQSNPHVYHVSYTRPTSGTQNASKAVNYLSRRYQEKGADKESDREGGPEQTGGPTRESSWYTLPEDQQTGNAQRFKEEARRRSRERIESARERGKDLDQDHSPKNVSYVHVVISPASRDEFSNEDFIACKEPWIRDRQGNTHEHYGAIHRDDPEGPKMHLVIARDRIHKNRELPHMKERTAGIIAERDRLREHERGQEREKERPEDRDRRAEREGGRSRRYREPVNVERAARFTGDAHSPQETALGWHEETPQSRGKLYVVVGEYDGANGKRHEFIGNDQPRTESQALRLSMRYNDEAGGGAGGGAVYRPEAVEDLKGREGRRIRRELKRQQKESGSNGGEGRADDDRDLEI